MECLLKYTSIWRFPQMGVPHKGGYPQLSSISRWDFPEINHPAIEGYFQEAPSHQLAPQNPQLVLSGSAAWSPKSVKSAESNGGFCEKWWSHFFSLGPRTHFFHFSFQSSKNLWFNDRSKIRDISDISGGKLRIGPEKVVDGVANAVKMHHTVSAQVLERSRLAFRKRYVKQCEKVQKSTKIHIEIDLEIQKSMMKTMWTKWLETRVLFWLFWSLNSRTLDIAPGRTRTCR